MKRFDIPRPPRRVEFKDKFGRDTHRFGGDVPRKPVRYGHLPLLLGLTLCVAILVLAVFVLAHLPAVRSVEAKGGTLYTADMLVKASGIEAGDELFGFDSQEAARRIKEKLPLLDSILVQKRLDGRVVIKATEHTELFYTRHNMNYYIFTADKHEVLMVASTPDEARRVGAIYVGLPESTRVRVGEQLSFINLPYAAETQGGELTTYEVETDEPAQEYAYVFEFVKAVKESDLASCIMGFETEDRYDLYFMLEGRIKVRIGTMDELDRKLRAAARTLADKEASGTLSPDMPVLVDVTDPARVILRAAPDINLPDWGV